MKERWALCVLGAWLMGSVMMFVIAPTNFGLIDELFARSSNASFRALVEPDAASARELLRYLASELNRTFFLRWNVAQVILGAATLMLLRRAADDRWLVALTLTAGAIALLLLGLFTPLITELGRSLDFVPRTPEPPELARFRLLHVGYTALALLEVACLAAASYRLARREPAARAVAAPRG